MAPLPPDTWQKLQKAQADGCLYLVDASGHPLELRAALDERCWAHLRDAQDGHIYVQELAGSRQLLDPRLLEMLGLDV